MMQMCEHGAARYGFAARERRRWGSENMMTKKEYVKAVKGIRAMLASKADAKCTCPKTKCEWHGRC